MIKKIVVGILSLSIILLCSSCNIRDNNEDITSKPNIRIVYFDVNSGVGEISYYYKQLENSKVNVWLEIYNKGNLVKKVEIPIDNNYSEGTFGLSINKIKDSDSVQWVLRHNERFKELTLDNIPNIIDKSTQITVDGAIPQNGEETTLVKLKFIGEQDRVVDKSEDEKIKNYEFVYFLKFKYETIKTK